MIEIMDFRGFKIEEDSIKEDEDNNN